MGRTRSPCMIQFESALQLVRLYTQSQSSKGDRCGMVRKACLYTRGEYDIIIIRKLKQNMQAKPSQRSERLLNDHKDSYLLESQRIEIFYDAKITAKIKKESKIILQRQSGLIQAATFTAILGPSGSGKTTLLNFLSGRLMSDNLDVQGELRFNSQPIKSVEPFSNQIGYVMQEDALLGTLTPRECFQFACNLRVNQPEEEKHKIVQDLISELGLVSCADVKVGNTFIKGISGGERKRTSIGVELITNPSIIFLDEPTTGLDSTTALQVILLLKNLAKQGKTVISTIHQPSSELFCEFDRLMLLVDGRCIYQGAAQEAYDHFETQGYKCPQLMNASEFYLDMMSITEAEDLGEGESYQEARAKHDEKVLNFESFYHSSKFHKFVENDQLEPVEVQSRGEISLFYEIYLITYRAFLCQVRNPMDVFFKLVQSVFTALIVLLVFGDIGPIDPSNQSEKLQNIRGVIFFLVASNAFGGIQGTLATFANERPVFLRERFSKSYKTFTYFLSRTGINFPFELVYPTAGALIIYWATNLGAQSAEECFKIVAMVNGVYFCAASYGLLYAALIPKLETAMALVPVLIIPFMLLGGFFINLDGVNDVRVIFYPIMYLSPFKYGFQGGIDAVGIPESVEHRTPADLWTNIIILIAIGIFFRIVSIVAMQVISNPKRPKMKKLGQSELVPGPEAAAATAK